MAHHGMAAIARTNHPARPRASTHPARPPRPSNSRTSASRTRRRGPQSRSNNVTSHSNRQSQPINNQHSRQVQSPTRAIRNHCISHKTNTRDPFQSPTFCEFGAPLAAAKFSLVNYGVSTKEGASAQPITIQKSRPAAHQSPLTAHQSRFTNHKVARPERFELPTLWFEARCSIQLSYGRVGPILSLLQAESGCFDGNAGIVTPCGCCG